MACCCLETQVANTTGTEDSDQRASYHVVRGEAAAPGARVIERRCVEGIACYAVVGESVAQRQGIPRTNLGVEFSRRFGFRTRDRGKTGCDLADLQSGKSGAGG